MKKHRFYRTLCAFFLSIAMLALLSACASKQAPVQTANAGIPPSHTLPPLPGAAAQTGEQAKPGQEAPPEELPAPGKGSKPIAYTHETGAFSIELPANFEIQKETQSSMYATRADHAVLCAGYNSYDMDIPMYSCDDLGDNREHCAETLWTSFGAAAYKIENAAYTSLNGARAYRIDCRLKLGEYETVGFIIGVDAPNYGCYVLFGSYYPEDTDAKEIENAIDSFRSTGKPNNGYLFFESDELGLRALYPADYCRGGTEVVYGRQKEGLVDSVNFYLHENRATMNYVEAERSCYGDTPQKALDTLDKMIKKSQDLKEVGTQEEGEIGPRKYLVRSYSVLTDDGGTVYITMAAMEIDGVVIAVGGIANEDHFDGVIELYTSVLRSIQPYDPSTSLL